MLERQSALADALAQGYIRQTIRQRAAGSEMAIEFLMGEAAKLKAQVQRSEQALQDYIRKTKSMSLQEKQDTVIAKLRNLSNQLLDAKAVLRAHGFETAFSAIDGVNGADTDWMEVRRIAGGRSVADLAWRLSRAVSSQRHP